jgi:hypothetical protein
MKVYEECLTATSTGHAPWYVVPADDKENARLIVSRVVIDTLTPCATFGSSRDWNSSTALYAASARVSLSPCHRSAPPHCPAFAPSLSLDTPMAPAMRRRLFFVAVDLCQCTNE